MKKTNVAAASGFMLCFLAIIFGVATNGGLKGLMNYIHIPSFIVTVGGALFAVMATVDSFGDFVDGFRGFFLAFKKEETSPESVVTEILTLSDTARKEGLLSLEESSAHMEDDFFHKGIRLIVDGTDPELVEDILESELLHREVRNKKRIRFWQDLGAYAPAWGMVGTLLGLINMMKTMGTDASGIGAGMSLALITTLYGSVIANWMCIPIARKLEKSSEQESLVMELIIEGVLSIQAGENTRIIREKVKAILDLKDE